MGCGRGLGSLGRPPLPFWVSVSFFGFWVCALLFTLRRLLERLRTAASATVARKALAGKISEGRAVPGGGIEDGSLQNGLLNFLDNYNRSSGISTTTRYY